MSDAPETLARYSSDYSLVPSGMPDLVVQPKDYGRSIGGREMGQRK